MSLDSVTHKAITVNPGPVAGACLGRVEARRVFEIKPQGGPQDAPPDETLPGWAPYGARQDANGVRRGTPAPCRSYQSPAIWGRPTPGRLDRAWPIVPGVTPWVDRRDTRRHLLPKSGKSAIVLEEKDRCVARYQVTQAAKCETGWVALLGTELRDDGDRQVRLVLRPKCGTRRCDVCDALIRAHQCARAEGDWRTFFTLTRDRKGTPNDAWRGIHAAVKRWHRELRRELSIAWRPWPLWESRHFEQRRERILLARDRINGPAKLEYAWCLESHKDGWPHVHECLNLWWLDFDFARALWHKCVKTERSNVDGKRVWSKDGACRYLSQYVAKGGLTPEILAMIRGRRAWASTGRMPEVPDNGFVIESDNNGDELSKQVDERQIWGEEEGWVLECGKDNGYAKWWRPYSILSPVEAVSTRGEMSDAAEWPDVKRKRPPSVIPWIGLLIDVLDGFGELDPIP